jgi:hypothetical protein
MRLFVVVTAICLIACKGNQHHEVGDTLVRVAPVAMDTSKTSGMADADKTDWTNYKIHDRKTMGKYRVSLWANQTAGTNPATGTPALLLIENSLTHKRDTLPLEAISDLQDREVRFVDITQSAGFPQLTIWLTWEGESDNDYSEVVGYQRDTLKELFEIPPSAYPLSLKRKEPHTLIGFIWQEDDVVRETHDKFLVKVSLPDYDVQISPPDTLAINYTIEVRDSIHANRLSTSGRQIPYTILPDTKIHVDTIFYNKQMVTLHLNDSIRLTVPHDSISFRLKVSAAG